MLFLYLRIESSSGQSMFVSSILAINSETILNASSGEIWLLSTTILQLAKGYSIIANGGFDITPKLIKGDKLMKEKKRVLTSDVSERLIKILRKVVSSDIGTANLADVKGYEIAGKTGTAQQPIKGEYSKIKINTFASI